MARKQKPAADPAMEAQLRFMGTYGDAITLLMAFFVMLYAISQVDTQKFILLVSGLEDPFKNSAAEQGLLETGTGIVGPGAVSGGDQQAVPGIELIPDAAPLGVEASEEEEGAETAEDRYLIGVAELEGVRDSLVEALQAFGLEPEVSLRLDARGLVVSIATDDVLFASGSPELSDAGREVIGALAPILSEFDNDILIEGHTDTVPLDQDGYTNWNLSADRALSVLEMLQTSDINPRRLSATGYGEFRPISDNSTEAGRAANRRVELVIVAATPAADTGATED
jgi:chemotaxis protein MotB